MIRNQFDGRARARRALSLERRHECLAARRSVRQPNEQRGRLSRRYVHRRHRRCASGVLPACSGTAGTPSSRFLCTSAGIGLQSATVAVGVRAYFTTTSGGLMMAENTSGWIPQALDSTKAVRRLSAGAAQLDDGHRLRFSADGNRREHCTAVSVRDAERGTVAMQWSGGRRPTSLLRLVIAPQRLGVHCSKG
jgi:hypothetical protein